MANQIPMVGFLELDGNGGPHLVAQECTSCGARFWDRRNGCAKCGGDAFTPKALATTGSLRAFTIVHRSAPGLPTPYISIVVDLDDNGGQVLANLEGVAPEPDAIEAGMKLRLTSKVFGSDDAGTEAVGFVFEPA